MMRQHLTRSHGNALMHCTRQLTQESLKGSMDRQTLTQQSAAVGLRVRTHKPATKLLQCLIIVELQVSSGRSSAYHKASQTSRPDCELRLCKLRQTSPRPFEPAYFEVDNRSAAHLGPKQAKTSPRDMHWISLVAAKGHESLYSTWTLPAPRLQNHSLRSIGGSLR